MTKLIGLAALALIASTSLAAADGAPRNVREVQNQVSRVWFLVPDAVKFDNDPDPAVIRAEVERIFAGPQAATLTLVTKAEVLEIFDLVTSGVLADPGSPHRHQLYNYAVVDLYANSALMGADLAAPRNVIETRAELAALRAGTRRIAENFRWDVDAFRRVFEIQLRVAAGTLDD